MDFSFITIIRRLERKFDLFYYDQLANQDEVIRLTIGELSSVEEVIL